MRKQLTPNQAVILLVSVIKDYWTAEETVLLGLLGFPFSSVDILSLAVGYQHHQYLLGTCWRRIFSDPIPDLLTLKCGGGTYRSVL